MEVVSTTFTISLFATCHCNDIRMSDVIMLTGIRQPLFVSQMLRAMRISRKGGPGSVFSIAGREVWQIFS